MNNLRLLRKESNITQAEIADFMKVNVKTISRWERGTFDIKPAQAKMLAEHFGVSVGYLLGETDNKKTYEDEKTIDDYIENGLILTYSQSRNNEESEERQFFNFVQYLKNSPFLLTDIEIHSIYNLLKSISSSSIETLNGKLLNDVIFTKEFTHYEKQFLNDYSIMHDEKYEKSENEIMLDVYLKELKIDIGIDGIISILKPIADKNHKDTIQ